MAVDWEKHKFWIVPAAVALIVLMGIVVRSLNTPRLDNTYVISKDPYLFLRYTDYVHTYGYIPTNDTMRYSPVGYTTVRETLLLPYVVAYLHKLAFPLGFSQSITQTAIWFPAFAFGVFLLLFFFVVRKLTNTLTSLTASVIIIFLKPFLIRTIAGNLDKEALAIIFFLAAFWAFFKAEEWWFYGVLAGVFTGLTGLTWGGMRFILLTIAMTAGVLWVLKRFPTKSYWVWLVTTIIFLLFTPRYHGITGILTAVDTGLPVFVGLLPLIDAARIRWLPKIRIPRVWGIVATLAVLGVVGFGVAALLGIPLFENILQELMFPLGTSRLTMSVSESQIPDLSHWWTRWNMLGMIAFVAAIAWFYRMVRPLRMKGAATFGFGMVLFSWLITSASKKPPLNGFTTASQAVFVVPVLLWAVFMGWLLWWHEKKHPHQFDQFCKTSTGSIFVLAFFLLALVAARGATRFFFVLSIPVAILLAWLFISIVQWAWEWRTKSRWTIIGITIGILALLVLPHALGTITTAQRASHEITTQWRQAFAWLAQETPQDAVVAAWWDYGYWIQTIGQRTTLLDGSNSITYWNHLFGRLVMTGNDPEEARGFLTAHKVDYLLLNSRDISTYSAFSLLGSDNTLDRLSKLYAFKRKREQKEKGTIAYSGRIQLPSGRMISAKLSFEKTNKTTKLTNAIADILLAKGLQTEQFSCVRAFGRVIWNATGIPGCLFALDTVSKNKRTPFGALLYLPPQVHNTLWARLYLFDEKIQGFEQVYEDDVAFSFSRSRARGPIKIWRIEPVPITEEQRASWIASTSPEWDAWKWVLPQTRK